MTNTKPIYKTADGEKAVMAFYESVLAQWPVPHETLTIPTRYGDTFVIASGALTAPPLVLLHGAATNSAIWAGDVVEYSHGYRVYAVDLLGEAGKSVPNRPPWNSPAYAEWLADVLDGLHVDKATLAGISQGGWTGLKFAVYKPERVEKLVLIAPGGVVPDRLSFIVRAIVVSLLGERGIRRMVRLMFADQPIPDGVEDSIALIMRHFNARLGVLPIFSDAEMQRLTMPTLLLGGSKDAVRDMEKIAARMRKLLPQLEVTIVPGGGHALMDTTPPVLAFLAGEHQPQVMA